MFLCPFFDGQKVDQNQKWLIRWLWAPKTEVRGGQPKLMIDTTCKLHEFMLLASRDCNVFKSPLYGGLNMLTHTSGRCQFLIHTFQMRGSKLS